MADGIYPELRWFEDFTVGQQFRFGGWVMERQEMIDFARRYDPEPFHIDEAQAIALGWSALIASGPMVASIWRRISKDAFPNVETVISPGWDTIRWRRPVYAGDVLTSRSEIIGTRLLETRPGEGLLKLNNETANQNGDVVMHHVSNWFVRCRTALA